MLESDEALTVVDQRRPSRVLSKCSSLTAPEGGQRCFRLHEPTDSELARRRSLSS